jgi:Peptidase family S41/N-terminal domain of Peptidase_S41 in eukaryotic IRBP
VPSQSGVNVADLVGQLVALLDTQYVFSDVAAAISRVLTDRLASGSYESVESEEALAAAITEDLQSVNGDRHLRLLFHADPIDEDLGEPEADLAQMGSWAALCSAGFPRVERLPGNVGYLRVQPVLFPISIAGEAATAAMTLLADTDALLLDLRSCLGGDPETVTWLCSYLFDEPVELSSFYERASDKTTPTWTLPEVPGRRFGPTKPVWLLCSGTTFSGGEALCYDLQQAGRAKVVGEPTGGGAHPREAFRLGPHLEATIPVARPINPHSGTNWEGTGVAPDVLVDADQAESTAYQLALEHVATLPNDGYRQEVSDEVRAQRGRALNTPAPQGQ